MAQYAAEQKTSGARAVAEQRAALEQRVRDGHYATEAGATFGAPAPVSRTGAAGSDVRSIALRAN